MTRTLRVTSLDEAFINLAGAATMSVQFEVRVQGQLDPGRLADAIRAAVAQHPLARARLAPSRLGATQLDWQVADVADHVALEVTDDPANEVRARLQSSAPDLSRSPAFLASLVRDPDGDLFMLNLHHAAFDGMGAVRLVTSIARAYAGQPDETGGPDIEEARDLRAIAGSRGLGDLASRAKKLGQDVVERKALTRVAPDGGDATALRYGFAPLVLSAEETARAAGLRPPGATLNDLALAAHAISIVRWNQAHDVPVGDTVSIMMPVNMRPDAWSTEVISNFASYLAVVVPTRDWADITEATAFVHERTKPLKENGAAGWIVDVLDRGNAVPAVLKKALPSLLPLVQKQFVETTVLSNVGRMSLPPFGDAGEVTQVWFSPPCMSAVMPLAFGLAGVGRELHAMFRADQRVISADALAAYAAIFRDVITGS